MPIITILAIYFIVWWICLFLVLPFRVKNQIDTGEAIVAGTERGAPAGVFRFWPKLLATTVLATLAGYAFGVMDFPLSTPLFYLFIIGLTLPQEALVVPLYFDLRYVELTDTYWALIFPQMGASVAFGTFWMRAFFRGVPQSLVEAARIDGASSWFTLWRVLLPLARPAVLTMTVLLFMWTWNEFLLALVMVSEEGLRTAPLGLSFFQGAGQALAAETVTGGVNRGGRRANQAFNNIRNRTGAREDRFHVSSLLKQTGRT